MAGSLSVAAIDDTVLEPLVHENDAVRSVF